MPPCPRSLESLEQATRVLREELEEAQGALREWQEQNHQRHIPQWEKENQRLAETIQELEGKVSKQREWEKTHKQALQQLRVQEDELQRHLWDMEAKRRAKADRIREKQRHMEELSGTIQGLSRRTQVLHRNISCWGDLVLEAQQEAELFQRKALYRLPGTPASNLLWEERLRDQTEKLLCQESGASGPRGRLPLRFLAYKLPWPRHSPPAEGMRYMYQDARSGGWVPGRTLMNSTQSAVGRTLLQLYQGANRRTEDTAYVLYNDQPPKNVPSSTSPRGHTKGVVLLDRAQGFWLLHSTPHYPPPVTETYAWPHSGLHNGQSFLCVTFPYAQFKEIDLYSGWVAQALSSDLYVQFWPNSRGVLPSNCSGPYRVYNIEELGFPAPGPDFPATVDHSKWCVSTESTPGWACVGDMNRNLEEEQRGGGTLCQQDPAVWKSYYALVQKYSKC
nr:deoxyribonuclease-2-alpha isoform X6 [Caretta caretta]